MKSKNNQLRKLADIELRRYLLRHWDGKCFITRRNMHETNVHASHYIDRNVIAHRWDVTNVHLVSAHSNLFDSREYGKWGDVSKHHFEYRQRLVEVYGEEHVLHLETPKPIKMHTVTDLEEIINFLKQ